MFELTGVYPSQYFFAIDNRTGVITVIKSLREDALQLTSYTVSLLPEMKLYQHSCQIYDSFWLLKYNY